MYIFLEFAHKQYSVTWNRNLNSLLQKITEKCRSALKFEFLAIYFSLIKIKQLVAINQ